MNFKDEIDPPGFFISIPGEIHPNTSGWVEFPSVFPILMSIMFNYIPMICLIIISHYTPTIFLIKVTIIISPLCFHEACVFSFLVPLFQCIPMMFLLLHYIILQ